MILCGSMKMRPVSAMVQSVLYPVHDWTTGLYPVRDWTVSYISVYLTTNHFAYCSNPLSFHSISSETRIIRV